ncbi:MAG: TRAP transporter small permease subunit [candidate division KSB1 bacterium]|nr:TRAP transporter small permease subunit [candidate division KSB1 bacterium]MDZ7273419.1 TRAP transporter small permease subunit [candidate division KSB1 bacterium]MDZ7286988.1 TRAP transporter small permease subunit [candidate division KSB1 bacterium]MDZ7299659.1 TRAP transporter small permease subunit [candidate division KSB1 bacterium]MDZ7350764.1 TRAP transporter small permease subunit [candidate division KSB1 bacterium]
MWRTSLARIAGLNEKIGTAVSWLTTGMMLLVCYDVFTRYLLKRSSVAVQELEWHLFAVLFLLGAGFTLKHDRHVRVDLFYARLPQKGRAWIDLFGSLFFLIPFAAMIIWTSLTFVKNAWLIGETSPDPGGLPARYLIKAAIPVGFALLLLQALAVAGEALRVILGLPLSPREEKK